MRPESRTGPPLGRGEAERRPRAAGRRSFEETLIRGPDIENLNLMDGDLVSPLVCPTEDDTFGNMNLSRVFSPAVLRPCRHQRNLQAAGKLLYYRQFTAAYFCPGRAAYPPSFPALQSPAPLRARGRGGVPGSFCGPARGWSAAGLQRVAIALACSDLRAGRIAPRVRMGAPAPSA